MSLAIIDVGENQCFVAIVPVFKLLWCAVFVEVVLKCGFKFCLLDVDKAISFIAVQNSGFALGFEDASCCARFSVVAM